MILFTSLLLKLMPIYLTMGMGYFLSKQAGNITSQLALLQIYFLAPLVICLNVMKLDFEVTMLWLPLTALFVCFFISTMVFQLLRAVQNPDYAIIAQGSGTANTGYLGVPIALIVFPPDMLPLYMLGIVATIIFENTLGYYFLARGQFSPKDALLKLLKLPTIYALILGLFLGHLDFTLPEMWKNFERDILGAYVVLGALIIGFGLSGVEWKKFDAPLISTFLSIKFLVWPVFVFLLVLLDQITINILTADMHKILLLMSCLPMAANTAAFAALFNTKPSQTALAVALSTLCGLIAIPLYITIFGLG
jgi:predicted permease